MSGYQETLTDPSYCGQIVVMTYPLVGNYGTNPCFNQGEKCFYQGYVVSELCDAPNSWRCQGTLQDFLEQQQVPVLVGVDTRAITRKLRNYGVLRASSCLRICRMRKYKNYWPPRMCTTRYAR